MSSPRAIQGERNHRHKLSFGHQVIQEQSRASRSNLEEAPAHARWWAIHFTARRAGFRTAIGVARGRRLRSVAPGDISKRARADEAAYAISKSTAQDSANAQQGVAQNRELNLGRAQRPIDEASAAAITIVAHSGSVSVAG
jgi:hypothetical protein